MTFLSVVGIGRPAMARRQPAVRRSRGAGRAFPGLLFVQPGDGESGVDDDPVADLDVLEQGEIRRDFRPQIVDLAGLAPGVDLDDLGREWPDTFRPL